MPSTTAATSRLGLGTVQFGLDYGIVNTQGQVSTADAHTIMLRAKADGVDVLDTAALYGSSEQVIGELLAEHPDTFRVVTKTVKWDAARPLAHNLERFATHIDHSLERLHTAHLGGLLLHDADDLRDERGGAALWALLQDRRERGQIARVGYSLYHPTQLKALLNLGYIPDLIQIPANAFDQRFVQDPTFQSLDRERTEVHVRSCFLQGTLLHTADSLPESYTPLRTHIDHWRTWLERHGLTPLQGALAYGLSEPRFDHVILGVQNLEQWAQIIEAANALDLDANLPWAECAMHELRWIDPSQWPPR